MAATAETAATAFHNKFGPGSEDDLAYSIRAKCLDIYLPSTKFIKLFAKPKPFA